MSDRTRELATRAVTQPTSLARRRQAHRSAERRVLDALAAVLPHATLRIFPELGHMGPITAAPVVNAAIVESCGSV